MLLLGAGGLLYAVYALRRWLAQMRSGSVGEHGAGPEVATTSTAPDGHDDNA